MQRAIRREITIAAGDSMEIIAALYAENLCE
jgi:hypothetical protein